VRTALGLLVVAALVAATVPAAAAPGAGSRPAPAATEIGVSATQIRIAVVADVNNSVEPGLFQANVDAVRALAKQINAHGGLAGRKVVVDFYDSQLSPTETDNAIIQACSHDFAMVGTGASLLTDITPLVTCPDQRGRPTGIPDLNTFALDPGYQCSTVSFPIMPAALDCSTRQDPTQQYRQLVGPAQYYLRQNRNLHGVYILSGDVQSVKDAALPLVSGYTKAGIKADGPGTIFVSSLAPASALTPALRTIQDHASTFVYLGVAVSQIASMRMEAALQGVHSVKLWTCEFECYDRTLLSDGKADVDGQYITSATIPFEEARTVPALAQYLKGVGAANATGFGVQAWSAGLLFEQVVRSLVAAGGPNGLTRAAFLSSIRSVRGFTAEGILGATDIGTRTPTNCYLVLQVQHGRFVRVYPKAAGTFDCKASNTRTIGLNLSQ